MPRLSGENVDGHRHDGPNKEIRSVPRKGLGGYCGQYLGLSVHTACEMDRKSGDLLQAIHHVHEGDVRLQGSCFAMQSDKVSAEDCWRKMAAHHRSLSEGGALTDCYICLEPIDGGISRISSETNNRVGDIGFWTKLCFIRFQSSIKTSTSCVSQSGWLLAKVSSKSSSGREMAL